MSKIAIIGATGHVGTQLLVEALRRGHTVTGIARNAAPLEEGEGVSARSVDLFDANALAGAMEGHDAVFSSARFAGVPASAIVGPVRETGVRRLMVVGGAGSLFVAPGVRVIDTPDFPPQYKEEAAAGAAFLDALRAEKELDWTFVSPSAEFVDGKRTQHFRLGRDELLVDGGGRSWITFQDFAIAFLDEFEKPAHIRQRFTVGY
ncbi:NAD-dependent epimerase/dehydratase [Caballeronia arationis]|jgi:putative NADH-flavin reductase|uniref:NADH-flavin reductase n=1 Tax=Caballeronia arationis TaxID=1777142 RepID=A0A7Z7N1M3_9BURK|nr:NAD(P)-dependent oxidoreductase [Caballeronia arationis]SAK90919.1 NAD-dependent epimerase/dehydratase [Caballeronia arationis]SOE60584.1 Putative NADH-flavin reductase [Caballeronia arationis]